ncbi:hypothetical protein ACFQZZ_02490 [Nocardia sp. GCM10030253]|uniref:hypothetical protein n=1 Tax=Nocardia sp. GCM10030253 TaxID=3273404 RepID=UPI00363F6BCA
MAFVRKGDTVTVHSTDRLARNPVPSRMGETYRSEAILGSVTPTTQGPPNLSLLRFAVCVATLTGAVAAIIWAMGL